MIFTLMIIIFCTHIFSSQTIDPLNIRDVAINNDWTGAQANRAETMTDIGVARGGGRVGTAHPKWLQCPPQNFKKAPIGADEGVEKCS